MVPIGIAAKHRLSHPFLPPTKGAWFPKYSTGQKPGTRCVYMRQLSTIEVHCFPFSSHLVHLTHVWLCTPESGTLEIN